jgi:hypothetical protein
MTTPTGYAEMFEWVDGNPNNEDRAGCTVALEGDRIRIATQADTPIGVVGGDNTSVAAISGASADEWHKKHRRDPAKRLLWEPQVMVEWVEQGYRHWYEKDRVPAGIVVPENATYYDKFPGSDVLLHREILSDEYQNPANIEKAQTPYKPRWDRNEWAIVVLVGRAVVRDGSQLHPEWKQLKALGGSLGGCSLSEYLIK